MVVSISLRLIALLSLLFAELTTAKVQAEPSLLTQFIVIEAFLFLLGVLGTAGVSGMIPLYGAFLFPIPGHGYYFEQEALWMGVE